MWRGSTHARMLFVERQRVQRQRWRRFSSSTRQARRWRKCCHWRPPPGLRFGGIHRHNLAALPKGKPHGQCQCACVAADADHHTVRACQGGEGRGGGIPAGKRCDGAQEIPWTTGQLDLAGRGGEGLDAWYQLPGHESSATTACATEALDGDAPVGAGGRGGGGRAVRPAGEAASDAGAAVHVARDRCGSGRQDVSVTGAARPGDVRRKLAGDE
mmetsp:Transcript_122415/g.346057  ORF Transcript_122415/g.346057 Transcript_122415/m.346057 type:complete len:214 (+) Transcript_122415:806-1447(+)